MIKLKEYTLILMIYYISNLFLGILGLELIYFSEELTLLQIQVYFLLNNLYMKIYKNYLIISNEIFENSNIKCL